MPYTATYNSISRILRGCYNFAFIITNSQNWGFNEVGQTGAATSLSSSVYMYHLLKLTEFSLFEPSIVGEAGQIGAAALLSFFNPYACITFSIPMFSLYEPSTVSEVGQTGAAALRAFLAS